MRHKPARLIAIRVAATLLVAPAMAFAQQGFDQAPTQAPTGQPPAQYPPSGYPPNNGMPPEGQPSFPPQGQNYPPAQGQASYPPSQGSGTGYSASGQAGPEPQGNQLQALLQQEMQDFGVQAQAQLQINLHGPTPTSIPGGQVVTTDRLLGLYQQGQQNGMLVFHVLGPGNMLPNAQNAAPASQPGSFSDQTQQEFGQYLQQVTQGNKARPMVFYCQNTQCWMSYNAALRAINMGFTQVLWYRGGIEAWTQAQQLAASMQPSGQQPAMPVNQPGGW